MAGSGGFDPTRIFVQLNNTRLQQKDPQLYQVIYHLIGELAKLKVDVSSSSSSSGGGSSSITNINQFLDSLDNSGYDSFDSMIPGNVGPIGLSGPIGPPGMDGLSDYDLGPIGFNINNNFSEVTLTTTGNIDDLDFGNVSLIRMNNASLSTIRGLKAGYAGQIVTIVSVNAQVDLAHQNSGSSAQNRLINFATSGNTSLAAATGNCSYKYDGSTARWRLITHNQGSWIVVPFSAGDFTAGGAMTWTVGSGDLLAFRYWLKDTTLAINLDIASSTTGGTPNALLIVKIPGGFTTAAGIAINTTALVNNDGITDQGGYIYINASGSTTFNILKITGATWANAIDLVNVFTTCLIEVQ